MGQKVKRKVKRLPYVMSEEEMTTLITGIWNFGPEETEYRILSRAENAFLLGEDCVDSMLMDMHDTLLKKARSYIDNDSYTPSRNALYHLARLMRIAAYKIRNRYKLKSDDHRFFRLISDNPDFPQFQKRD